MSQAESLSTAAPHSPQLCRPESRVPSGATVTASASPADHSSSGGADGGSRPATSSSDATSDEPQSLEAWCLQQEETDPERQNWTWHPQFSIADDQGSQRFEALIEQFMQGSVQLQRAFDEKVENELRVLDSPSATLWRRVVTTGRVE